MIIVSNVSGLSSTNHRDSQRKTNHVFGHWYFAYGSNLCVDQLRTRLGPHVIIHRSIADLRPRLAQLPNYQVEFSMLASDGHFYANLTPSHDEVIGVLYRCDSIALQKLDQFEDGYHRARMKVFDATGQSYEAEIYVARPENVVSPGKPTFDYLNRILRGGLSHGLPTNYLFRLEMAASSSISNSSL